MVCNYVFELLHRQVRELFTQDLLTLLYYFDRIQHCWCPSITPAYWPRLFRACSLS